MMNKIATLIVSCSLVACGTSPAVLASKPSAPVSIEYTAPSLADSGSVVNSTIQFVAESNLSFMKIAVSPYRGLELVSAGSAAEFSDVGVGESRSIDVGVRLTGGSVGYLSLFVTTTDLHGRTQTKSSIIKFGDQAGSLNKSMGDDVQSGKDSNGEKLILMPAESR